MNERSRLTPEDERRLRRTYEDLKRLTLCEVPSVRAAAVAALAQIHTAVNGQGMEYDLYTSTLLAPQP